MAVTSQRPPGCTKIRLPHTTGVEFPRSGKGVRQRTFWFVLQYKGSLRSREIPEPSGPRQAGHGPASADQVNRNAQATGATKFKNYVSFVSAPKAGKRQIQSTAPGVDQGGALQSHGDIPRAERPNYQWGAAAWFIIVGY